MDPEGSLPHHSACHLSLSWASSIQSILPHPISRRSILILSSHLSLGLPNGLFSPHQKKYMSRLSTMRATCPAHLLFLDFISRKILGEEYKSLSLTLCSILLFQVTSSPLGQN